MGNERAGFYFSLGSLYHSHFLKRVFLKQILKFEGGPYGFKKKSKSTKEELKPVFFFFFFSTSKSWGPISKISEKLVLCAS